MSRFSPGSARPATVAPCAQDADRHCLVFAGGADRGFSAMDVRTGEVLRETRLGHAARGFPVAYAAGGRQSLAVPTGLGIFRGLTATLSPEIHQARTGNAPCVFALPW